MSRKSLSQQMEGQDARHAARQAAVAKPLSVKQAAAKFIASIKQNAKGTLPLSKVSRFDKGLKQG